MREIEFRGKRKDNQEWIYGGITLPYFGDRDYSIVEEFGSYPVIETTIGQYTGLKDKNKVKIYEKDIIKFAKYIGTVNYEYGSFIITNNIGDLSHCQEKDLEVIGNIYDNLELLKGEEK